MGKKLPDLVRRTHALHATRERFRNKPLGLGLGKGDCGKLTRFHLVAMGHDVPRLKPYSNRIAATRELRRLATEVDAAAASLEAVLDALVPRIAPAAMLPGDLAMVAAEGPAAEIGTIVVLADQGQYWGWRPDRPDRMLNLVIGAEHLTIAWRA